MPAPHPNPPPQHISTLPPRPTCRPASSPAGTLCFWTVLLLFLAAIGFLGMLAFTRNSRHSEPDLISGDHLTIGLILVGCAIAAVASVICTRYKRLP